MPDLIVVEQLQAFLVTEGVGQMPAADPSLTIPSIWRQPRDGGAPLPRKPESTGQFVENATITLNKQTAGGPPTIASWLEDSFVDITTRTIGEAEGELLHRVIAGLLHPIGAIGGRKHWQMGGLLVQESRIWRREQALKAVGDGATYDRLASYQFRCARSTLAA